MDLGDPEDLPTREGNPVVVGGLALLEARRRNEDRFLANLGVSPVTIALLSMIPSSLAEITIRFLTPR